jgi:hypothetical protein
MCFDTPLDGVRHLYNTYTRCVGGVDVKTKNRGEVSYCYFELPVPVDVCIGQRELWSGGSLAFHGHNNYLNEPVLCFTELNVTLCLFFFRV